MQKDDSSNQNPSTAQPGEMSVRIWEEDLQFEVDGVTVKAHASYLGRGVKVVVLEPYKLDALNMMPPLFAAGHAMRARLVELDRLGVTETQDSIRHAKNAYLEHLTYLKLKPEIDKLEEAYLRTVQDELNTLKAIVETEATHFQQEKARLRKAHMAGAISEQQRSVEVKKLEEVLTSAREAHGRLAGQVTSDLKIIKRDFLEQAAHR